MTALVSPPVAALPGPLRSLLLAGGVGKLHLARTAFAALAHAGSVPGALARDLLLAAWESDPLDGGLARAVLEHAGNTLAPNLHGCLAALATGYHVPADLKYFARLAERREHDKIERYLAQMRAKEPGNLFWVSHELTHALSTGDYVRARELAATRLPSVLAGVAAKIAADAALCQGDAAGALAGYASFAGVFDGPAAGLGRARALTLLGRREDASAALAGVGRAHPWCVNAMLALHDRVSGADTRSAALPGRAAVLLYTFNKAAEIDFTLRTLEASLPLVGESVSAVLVLDNGSTDATPDALAAAKDRLGGLLRVIRLPVNVGAPAARNWLMREPDVKRSEFTVYLDDDVDLPGNWLLRLAAAHAAYPEAGVYGCKVVDQAQPLQIQSADLHLEVLPETPDAPDIASQRRFDLSSLHHQVLDAGQFGYLRPCASVTGCLHMFATETLFACGDFDLRFSPSQYDDLDHDFRLLAMGKTAVYQGHLGLPHFKRTGRVSGKGGTGYGVGFANQYKLHGKYSREELRSMAETAERAVLGDYLAKWSYLHENGVFG